MRNKLHTVLYIPAETFPTHHSLMTEVYSKNDYPVKTVFLMRHDEKEKKVSLQPWNKAHVYLFPRYSKFGIINSVKRYFRVDLRYLYLIPYIIFKHKISIIQVRDITFPLLVALLIKVFSKKKVIYQKSFPHEYWKMEDAVTIPYRFSWLIKSTTRWENRVLHYIMRFCDVIFPISSHMAKKLQADYGLPVKKMYPLGLGFNFESISDSDRSRFFEMHQPVKLIYVGTLSLSREFEILLQGLADVIKTLPDANLEIGFIGGTDQEVHHLKKVAAELDIGRICYFTGKIDRSEVYKKIMESDIGISWFGSDVRFVDASPTKMIEYLSLGVPVIATDSVEEHKVILDDTNAGVCCMVDKGDFSKMLIKLMGNYNVYKNAADNSIHYMKDRYSYHNIFQNIVKIYDFIGLVK